MSTQNRLEDYEVLDEIGRGGMATVYLARQRDLGRLVALKRLSLASLADEGTRDELLSRFDTEAKVTGGFRHPSVVTVHAYFAHEGDPYIAMEYFRHGSLRRHMRGLSPAQQVRVLEDVLAALQYVGAREIVHRDLKPENLMVTDEGAIKVADFGIAKALGGLAAAHATATNTTMGTLAYMSPEQARGEQVTPAADLYATGAIGYELMLGRPPFTVDDNPLALLNAHSSTPPPDPTSIAPGFDRRLADWLTKMLAKTPGGRPPGPAAAWDELEEIAVDLLGPTWRREAAIVDPAEAAAPAGRSTVFAPLGESEGTPGEASAPDDIRDAAPQSTGLARFLLPAAGIAILALVGVVGFLLLTRPDGGGSSEPPANPEVVQNGEPGAEPTATEPTLESELSHVVEFVAFSPDDNSVISTGRDDQLRRWDAATGEEFFSVATPRGAGAALSPDGSLFAMPATEGFVVRDMESGGIDASVNARAARSLTWSPDGNTITAATFEGVRQFDSTSGEQTQALDGEAGFSEIVRYSPDGASIALVGRTRVSLLASSDLSEKGGFDVGERQFIRDVKFTPDSKNLVIAFAFGEDQPVQVRDLQGKKVRGIMWDRSVSAVAVSPDGARIVTGGSDLDGGGPRIWNLATGQQELVIQHSASVNSLDWSADGSRIVAGSDDETARVWDAATGRELMLFSGHDIDGGR